VVDSINGLAEGPSSPHDLNENETRADRVERSASPILHDRQPVGPNDVHFPEDLEKDVSAGRYFHYNIKPTGTFDNQEEQPERTHQGIRAGKTLSRSSSTSGSSSEESFLGRGDLRPLVSGSPIRPSPSSTATLATAASATQAPHSPRQNGNPDIQDIITGIVKLLNGNVNVHANTQGVRRPSASRINNRGPPRISEAQNLPIDYEAQKPGTSMRPPPYPFDRPERPFITGVPIPEQIVPVRPGLTLSRSSSTSGSSSEESFLGRGDLRPLVSGSPIRPSPSSTATLATAASATQAPHSPRQNGNPDIQDIITGIVLYKAQR